MNDPDPLTQHDPSIPLVEGEELNLEVKETINSTSTKPAFIGKIINKKIINKTTANVMIVKGWNLPTMVSIVDIGPNKFLLQFEDEESMKRIAREAPWNIMGNRLSLQPWTPQMTVDEVKFDQNPFWVQLHGLPLDMMTLKNAARVYGRLSMF
ncbi:hypothetical protein SESBI_02619 [Sesbania bispinosa]|nr:hypothetical protein SESBI_02619 [Sesbania bispinosa]